MSTIIPPDASTWQIARRSDGSLTVRVPSRRDGDDVLPDAVFSFRLGDPQYRFWERQLLDRDDEDR